jgi:hypothetical protein
MGRYAVSGIEEHHRARKSSALEIAPYVASSRTIVATGVDAQCVRLWSLIV